MILVPKFCTANLESFQIAYDFKQYMKQFGNLFKVFYLPSPEYPTEATIMILTDFRLRSKDSFAKFQIFYPDPKV